MHACMDTGQLNIMRTYTAPSILRVLDVLNLSSSLGGYILYNRGMKHNIIGYRVTPYRRPLQLDVLTNFILESSNCIE